MDNLLANFKKEVGNYCAVCAYIELSLRSMQSEHKGDLKNKDSLLSFSKIYNIYLSNCDPSLLATAVPQYYILNVYRCLNLFYKDCINLSVIVRRMGKITKGFKMNPGLTA